MNPLMKNLNIRAKELLEVVKGVCRTSLQMAFLEHSKKGEQTDCLERSVKAGMQVKLQDTKKNVWGDRMLLRRWSPFDLMQYQDNILYPFCEINCSYCEEKLKVNQTVITKIYQEKSVPRIKK